VLAEWMRNEHGAAITWLPYDLHPEYPPEGIPRDALRKKYGEVFHDRTRELFERNGLVWNPSETVPNTRNPLRVTELARDRGVHDAFHDQLMEAYWERGENIADHEVLRAHAHEVGLDRDEVDRVLAGDDYLDRVQASTQQALSIGVSGIPAFLLDSRLLVLGAQPRAVFERALADV
jgi:predicted DsbA family dithiol-disulfide isomerase